ncbi:olfactory receptor 10AG1-like [Loxodonta africana]|uniref:olfactory receptor 10AG1-like n=1 Tax=Loxodonta africana TaxID=9785 RepID=UPI0030CC48F7
MAYDRYVAICNPLNYPLVMNHRVCIQLVTGSWTIGIPVMVGYTYQIFSLPFCGSNQINHFFCDIPPILKLACGDIFVNEMLVYIVAVLFGMVPFLLILGSYSTIISVILKLPSATSRAKAFSTCSSHLTVVVLFFGMLMNLGTQRRRISSVACATQMCFVLMFGDSECLLLAVMAYDRYVAICNSLHYPLVMNHRVCIQLVTGSWTIGIPVMIGQTYQVFSLPFCGSNQINHFFCDIPPILKLAFGDTFVNELLLYTVSVLFVMVPFLLILGSYSKVISIILKLPSATSQAKAFSTCSSHLMVVKLFFGSGMITYLRPNTRHSEGTDKVLSLFYTILTPMFNPMIYSLRNKDVIMALRKLLSK